MNDRYYLEVNLWITIRTDNSKLRMHWLINGFANRTTSHFRGFGRVWKNHYGAGRIGIDPLLLQKCLMFTYNRKSEKMATIISRFLRISF